MSKGFQGLNRDLRLNQYTPQSRSVEYSSTYIIVRQDPSQKWIGPLPIRMVM